MGRTISYIHNFLHFLHRPFSKIITQQQFRYLAAGGTLALLDVIFFFIFYHYLLGKEPVSIGGFVVESYRLAFWLAFPINLVLSYLSSKYIVFPGSHLPHGIQLFRYLLLVVVCIFLNYFFLVFFVDICSFYPSFSKLLTTALVAGFSYLVQRHFTFKSHSATLTKKQANMGSHF